MDIMELFGLRYYEAVEIQALNLNTMLWMIQFWITATFALIVAFHFAGTAVQTDRGVGTRLVSGRHGRQFDGLYSVGRSDHILEQRH